MALGDMEERFEQLTHLVYEASLDNSLWPELILELTEEVQRVRDSRYLEDANAKGLANLSLHFKRAFSISKRMVDLQEKEAYLSSVLNSFSFGVAMLDDTGQVLMANRSMQEILPADANDALPLLLPEQGEAKPLSNWVRTCNQTGVAHQLQLETGSQRNLMLLPRQEAETIGFPSMASAVLISSGQGHNGSLSSFAQSHSLTNRESQLVGLVTSGNDLRQAASEMGISYESARTYLKHIYEKTGLHSQPELTSALTTTPLAMLRRRELRLGEEYQVRQMLQLRDGRNLEFFRLGPATGKPVLVFDALSGVTIDMLGYPDLCSGILERHGVQLISPCRPGGFRSDLKIMSSLREFSTDIEQLLAHLKIDRFSILSVSFGSGTALGVAHDLQDRVDKIVLSSAAYPEYRHENWRELDQFYHMSSILGRHWPSMLRQVIPFLVRSILQNRDRYFDRYCNRARSPDDIEILSHPTIRRRTAEMLAQRTAQGVEGMVEENLLNAQGWDFDVHDIPVPTEIFQGDLDNVAPVQGAEMLADHLPNATLTALLEKGHYHHITNWPWLVARAAGHDLAVNSDRYCIPDL